MDIKHGVVAALVGLVVLFGGLYYIHPASTPAQVPQVGALAGPEIPYDHLTWGLGLGSTVYPVRSALVTGTTTPFSAQAPAATSTEESFSCQTTNSTSTTQSFILTKGLGMQSSTTALSNTLTVSAGATQAIIASSTPDSARVIAPNNFVQFNAIGGTGFSNLTGFCTVVFRII